MRAVAGATAATTATPEAEATEATTEAATAAATEAREAAATATAEAEAMVATNAAARAEERGRQRGRRRRGGGGDGDDGGGGGGDDPLHAGNTQACQYVLGSGGRVRALARTCHDGPTPDEGSCGVSRASLQPRRRHNRALGAQLRTCAVAVGQPLLASPVCGKASNTSTGGRDACVAAAREAGTAYLWTADTSGRSAWLRRAESACAEEAHGHLCLLSRNTE